jgi:TM2 domain-containing membrane protein YozV
MAEGIPPEIAEDLYEYPLKRRSFAYVFWALLGIVGGHRLYLNRIWTGIAMLLTLGGVLIWWIVDFFLIPRMVFHHNTAQGQRRDLGLPPVALDFLPTSDGSELARPPPWYKPRSRQGLRGVRKLLTDAFVLVVAGSALGVLSRLSGNIEAVAAVVALVVVLNFGKQMAPLHHVPLIGDLVRWSYRLRLFYHHVKPGNALARLFRPAIGIFYAPFRKKSRAEVGLYLRLGGAFVVLFLLEDLATEVVQPFVTQASLAGLTGVWWIKDVVLTLVYIFAFTAPIGATLMIYLLTRSSRFALLVLSGVTLGAVGLGLLG